MKQKKKLVEVVIDRKRWFRGDNSGNSALRLKNGKQCCLGFACRALGRKVKEILNANMPSSLVGVIPGLSEMGLYSETDTRFSNLAAEINDDPIITDKDREKQLKSLAKQNGFNFKFVN